MTYYFNFSGNPHRLCLLSSIFFEASSAPIDLCGVWVLLLCPLRPQKTNKIHKYILSTCETLCCLFFLAALSFDEVRAPVGFSLNSYYGALHLFIPKQTDAAVAGSIKGALFTPWGIL